MKSIKRFSLLIFILIIANTSVFARGHGGGHWGGGHYGFGGFYGPSIGFYSGPGYGGYGGYGYSYGQPYYPPVYSYPPVVTVQPSQPPVYIENQSQPMAPPQQPSANYWYYCRNPEGYYPYIKQCLGNWQQVPQQPSVR